LIARAVSTSDDALLFLAGALDRAWLQHFEQMAAAVNEIPAFAAAC